MQKFGRLLVKGLAKNGIDIHTLSAAPVSNSTSKRICWNEQSEEEDGVRYRYVPFINIPGLRHVCLFVYSFFYVLYWGIGNRKDKAIICDVLNISLCIGSLYASKIVKIKSVGVVTDIPAFASVSDNNISGKKGSMKKKINQSYLSKFICYVILTEQMNEVVNKKHCPYIVIEGLADVNMKEHKTNKSTSDIRTVMYAGGLFARYGLKTLVEAFMTLPLSNIRLALYGDGQFVDELKKYQQKDPRICYLGVVPNEKIVSAELSATLLVNPRPTTEEFTKFSFPSKNMEYMVSGTPLLTTTLPGMPKEYYPYVYLFDKETTEGYAEVLLKVLSLPNKDIEDKGQKAKEFVLSKKNNVVQAARLLSLINDNSSNKYR
ncbi:MAG: glycosyltransferase [Eubacteriales bacterium]|nr:glycosyltransferase [Eubacteriales bacterium]